MIGQSFEMLIGWFSQRIWLVEAEIHIEATVQLAGSKSKFDWLVDLLGGVQLTLCWRPKHAELVGKVVEEEYTRYSLTFLINTASFWMMKLRNIWMTIKVAYGVNSVDLFPQ